MKKDLISKEILTTIIKDIAKYILKLDIKEIEFLNTEKNRLEQRRADVVAKVDNSYILHLEIQNNNDKNMPLRMLRYFLDIRFSSSLPIKQFVIYIGKEKLLMNSFIKEENLEYNFNIIDMKEIDCDILLKTDTPDALVLAILCDFKDKNPKDVIKYIIKRLHYHTRGNANEFRKYMLMLEELSTNRDFKDILKEDDMLSEINFEKHPSYEIAMEKGMQRGLEKGLQQGVQEGKKMVARSLLKKKLFDEKTIANLAELPLEVILELKKEIDAK